MSELTIASVLRAIAFVLAMGGLVLGDARAVASAVCILIAANRAVETVAASRPRVIRHRRAHG